MTDDDFDYFLTKFPLATEGPRCTPEHLDTYTGLVPDALLSYWQAYGFSGFGRGIVWLTDPTEWRTTTDTLTSGIVHPDLGANATYIPFARTAYGRTHFWTPGFGKSLAIDPVHRSAICNRGAGSDSLNVEIQTFFASGKQPKYDLTASGKRDDPGLFDPALEQYGTLNFNEIYGFAPALALGGAAKIENVMRFEIHAHLTLLRSLAGTWNTAYLNI